MVAILLSFYGDRDEVSDLMQKVNHQTRVYFLNAHNLRGFLVSAILAILRKSHAEGSLENVTRYQQIDM